MLTAFDEGRLFGARTGTGRPWVLALHGWRRTHADFAAVLGEGPASGDASAGSGAVAPVPPARAVAGLAIDLPGFGATPDPPEAWGSAQYADAMASVLADMATPVVAVGHSFGGGVALHLAASHPELVAGVVLTGVPRLVAGIGGGQRPATRYRAGRLLHDWGLVSEGRMEVLRQRYGSADYRLAAGVMRQVLVRTLAETYEQQLEALCCPVELVWGDDDTAAPLALAEAAVGLIAHPNLTVCRGAGHLTPLSVPGALRQAIERCRPSSVEQIVLDSQ